MADNLHQTPRLNVRSASKTEVGGTSPEVRFTVKSRHDHCRHDHATPARPKSDNCRHLRSLNHLINRSEKTGRHSNAEGFGGLEVDDELEFRRLHYGHVSGPFSFEDTTGIDTDLAISILNACPIAHQTTFDGGGTRLVCSWNCGLCS